MRTLATALTLVSLIAVTPCVATAEPRPVALSFVDRSDDPSCPDEAAFRARVDTLIDGRAFDARSHRIATVSIESTGDLQGRVGVRTGDRTLGDRTIETGRGDCPALLASVALSLVLVIDPVRGLELMGTAQPPVEASPPPPRPEPGPAVPEPGPAVPEPGPAVPEPPRDPRPEPVPTVIELDSMALVTIGLTPGIGAALTVGGTVRRPAWSIAVEGRLQPGSSAPHLDGRVRAALMGIGPRACLHRAHIAACAVALFGLQPVEGEGFDSDTSAIAEVAFVGARVQRDDPLGDGWALRVAADVFTPLGTTRLIVDGETAWQGPAIAVGAGFGVVYRFR